jgi:hypothetical protein
MTTAEEIVALTARVHALASTPEGALMTRHELERLAAQQIAIEKDRADVREKDAGSGYAIFRSDGTFAIVTQTAETERRAEFGPSGVVLTSKPTAGETGPKRSARSGSTRNLCR